MKTIIDNEELLREILQVRELIQYEQCIKDVDYCRISYLMTYHCKVKEKYINYLNNIQ